MKLNRRENHNFPFSAFFFALGQKFLKQKHGEKVFKSLSRDINVVQKRVEAAKVTEKS